MYTHINTRITICKTNSGSIPRSSADRPKLMTNQEDRTTRSRAPAHSCPPGPAEADGPCRLQQSNPRRRNRPPRRASANLPTSGTHTLAKLSDDCVSLITAWQPLIRPLDGCVWPKAAGVIVAPVDGIRPVHLARPRSTSCRTIPIADDNSCPCAIFWREHNTEQALSPAATYLWRVTESMTYFQLLERQKDVCCFPKCLAPYSCSGFDIVT